jgi:hypothetical protein
MAEMASAAKAVAEVIRKVPATLIPPKRQTSDNSDKCYEQDIGHYNVRRVIAR